MAGKKTDRRVIKTKRAIRKAFIELLTQKHINDISIKEISELADINRKTFYNYYAGIHDLLEELENDMVSKFEENLSDFDFRRDIQTPNRTFVTLSERIDEDSQLYQSLFQSKSNSHIVEKITDVLVGKTINFLQEKYDLERDKIAIVTLFVSGGLMSVYQHWLDSERTMSLEEISAILSKLIESGVAAVLPINK
ncbi:MAG: TetR/AcrR family transcriptional regulator [Eubacteriaceae bacterium]|nr:TetR/AcrR family transcriptional regulator [Eubacteriaceae bacterium]